MIIDMHAFRTEIRDWLAANLTAELREAGAKMTSVFTEASHALAWQRILNSRGWAAPHWPAEHGGPGWNEVQAHVFAEECERAGAPHLSPMGMRMVAPCIMAFGTPEQKSHYLPRLLSGEDYWCQGYSEPGSGSDLASLQLRAERDGDDYVLNGSKIWTTHAQFANKMFCLVRTDRSGKPQAGISFLLLDMASPGITVAPIYSIAEDHDFNQVFFDNVRVPITNRLGDENQGWTVAKYLLEFERASAYAAGLVQAYGDLRRVAAATPDGMGGVLTDDPNFTARLAALRTQLLAIEASEARVMAVIARGGNPGPASSMLKVQGTETQQAIQELGVEVSGHAAAAHEPAVRRVGANVPTVGGEWQALSVARYLNGRAASIYGGSNEIQRNILARLTLGLS